MITILKTIPVRFYAEESGKEPVKEWLRQLTKEERKIIGDDIKAVQLRWPLGMPLVGPLVDGLWEVRSTLNNKKARVIFKINDGQVVLLHGFIKKTKKTPLRDLDLAKKRAKNI